MKRETVTEALKKNVTGTSITLEYVGSPNGLLQIFIAQSKVDFRKDGMIELNGHRHRRMNNAAANQIIAFVKYG